MMNCSKNMIRVGVGIGTVFLAAYLALPEFRSAILGLAPFALALLCPISMLLMMKMMMPSSKSDQAKEKVVVPATDESAAPVVSGPVKPEEAAS